MKAYMSVPGAQDERAETASDEAQRILAETEPIRDMSTLCADAPGTYRRLVEPWTMTIVRAALADALRAFVGE